MSQLTDLFSGIANAIRTKSGSNESIQAADFATAIGNIPNGVDIVLIDVLTDGYWGLSIPNAIGKENIFIIPYNADGWASSGSHQGTAYIAAVNGNEYLGYYTGKGGNGCMGGVSWYSTKIWDSVTGKIADHLSVTPLGQTFSFGLISCIS